MQNGFNSAIKRQILIQKYNSARINLLLVVAFTVINIILLVTKSNSYFLFSAFLPYELVNGGMYLCGMHPEEYYADLEGFIPLDNAVFTVLLVISIVILAVYLLCFFLSKKQRVGWLIVALVLFGIDTLLMLYWWSISTEVILDILFHGCVLFILANGIINHFRLKKMPEEAETPSVAIDGDGIPAHEDADSIAVNSSILRIADMTVRSRTLAEAEYQGIKIVYRRVKHVNELIINGNVYDEISGVVEFPHVLCATYNGHNIQACYSGSHSIIAVDGQELAKKLRLV